VTTAGLLVITLTRLSSAVMGFEPSGVVVATVDFRREHGGLGANLELQREVLEGIKAIPGVRDAGISNLTPVGGGAWNNPITTDYLPPIDPSSTKGFNNVPWFNSVSPGYFRTLRTRLLAGRDFDDNDGKTAPRVAIVNEAAVRRYFGGQPVLGKTFRMGEQGGLSDPITVVGVVENATYRSIRASNEPTFYLAAAQDRDEWAKPSYVVRAELAPSVVMEGIKAVAARVDPRMSLSFTTLEEKISRAVRRERVLATLSAVFGGIAFVLSMIGLYGVMAYTVARRRVEIGVRIALGAGRSRVVRMVLGDIGRMMAVGIGLGAAGAFLATPLVKQFLYGVEPNDPVTIVTAISILALGALAAGAIPARRAASLQPIEALRED
jgi:predicted permease